LCFVDSSRRRFLPILLVRAYIVVADVQAFYLDVFLDDASSLCFSLTFLVVHPDVVLGCC
jgi:hypothetical protein